MKKPKMSLTEELRKIDHINGYNKDFNLEESKRYTQQTKSRTYDLKILTEESVDNKYKNLFTEGEIKLIKENPQILNEFFPAIAAALTRLPMIGRALPALGRGMSSFGGKYLTKLPTGIKNIMGFGKIKPPAGFYKAPGMMANGKFTAQGMKAITNMQATKGLGSLLGWGSGLYMLGGMTDGSGSAPVPGDAVTGQEDWLAGKGVSKDDWLSMCFSPEYYQSLLTLDKDDSEITVTFQSQQEIIQIAQAIQDATEGGEKYAGKSIVDFISLGMTSGAGTDEDAVYASFRAIKTVGDCSHLSMIYQQMFNTPLFEELMDELDESEISMIHDILKNKPLAIINGQEVKDPKDFEELLKKEKKDIYKRPEGLPAYRISFKTLFGGDTVDLFVATSGGKAVTAIVFKAGSEDYLGQFQYIENSDDKYYFQTPDGQNYGITDAEDKAKLAKVFGRADDEKDAGEDIETLTKSIEVGGTIYEAGETLEDISGPEGSAAEYIDELVRDNPRTATAKPTALQGAAIALAMGVENFEVLTESVKGLGKVLGESRVVVEQKYSVSFNTDDNAYKVTRVRRTNPNDREEPSPNRNDGSSSYGVAPTLTSVAAGNGIIKKGMRGDSVAAIQRLLSVTISGIFDSKTEQAVKTYQNTNGLKVDGIVGPETAKVMVGALKPNDEVKTDEVKKDEEEIKNISGRFATDDEAKKVITKMEDVKDDQVSKEDCKSLIGAAYRALPTLGGPETYKVLQFCYAKYNFGLGRATRRVKTKYGIKGDGDLRNKRR